METLYEHIELLMGVDDNAYKCFIFVFIPNNAMYMTACGTDFDTRNSRGKKLFLSMPLS